MQQRWRVFSCKIGQYDFGNTFAKPVALKSSDIHGKRLGSVPDVKKNGTMLLCVHGDSVLRFSNGGHVDSVKLTGNDFPSAMLKHALLKLRIAAVLGRALKVAVNQPALLFGEPTAKGVSNGKG